MATPVTASPINMPTVTTVGFLVIPNFTTIGFASAIETLRMANMAARCEMFRTLIIAPTLDPVTATVCTLEQIQQMFDEMYTAQRQWLPQFA